MPLETATYISDLVSTNPAASDGMNNADDHMRLIKASVKTTFPNVTGAITATQDALNAAGVAATSGVTILADAGVFFKTNTTDGFTNPLSGDIDITLTGIVAGTFQRTASTNFFKWHGTATFDGEVKGPGIPQPGATMLWWDDTLPTDGLWAYANGQVVANASTVCPILLARWGSRFGGNGLTTMGLPDLREVVPVGKSTMGATAARGILTQFTSTLLNTINGWIGEALHTMIPVELASHRHVVVFNDPGHAHVYNAAKMVQFVLGYGGGPNNGTLNDANYTTSTNFTGGFVSDNAGNNNVTGATGTATPFNVVQPSAVVNWIIRLG